jgi:hypothetical protein
MQWISVKDRLPKIGVKVLTCHFGNPNVSIDYIDYPKDGNLWALIDKSWTTHWMPLPLPPKE